MSLNPFGNTSYNWNYSKPDREGYSPMLVGTVYNLQEVQKMTYTTNGQPGQPEFWDAPYNKQPKMNIRLILIDPQGRIKTFTFQPAGKMQRAGKKPSVHMDLWNLAGGQGHSITELKGKTIGISTEEGHYGQGHPRPWQVGLVEDGPYEPAMPVPAEFDAPTVLANTAVSGGQFVSNQQPPMPQQMPQQQWQQQPQMPQQMPQQAMPQQMPQQPMPQQMPQQMSPQMQPQMPQQMPQQVPQYPQGMNPSIAQQMQNAAPVAGNVYDDIPF